MLGLSATNPISANLFAYCSNNPVMYSDPTGYFVLPSIQTILLGAIIGGVLSALIDAVIQITFENKKISNLDWSSINIEFVSGAITGALIACNLPPSSSNLCRGINGMFTSLAHSLRQGKLNTIKGAFEAFGQAIISGAATIIIGNVRAKYRKTLNYNDVKQMVSKIGVNRAIRGGIRMSFSVFGWIKFNFVLN